MVKIQQKLYAMNPIYTAIESGENLAFYEAIESYVGSGNPSVLSTASTEFRCLCFRNLSGSHKK